MTENVRQCWAFHRDGVRCEQAAGHAGDHSVQKTWTDMDCAIPGEPATPSPAPLPAPLVQEVVSCVACQHKHKGGPCKCGCYEFVG